MKLSKDRINKYRQKFSYILEKITDLPHDLHADKYYLDAFFYRIQVSIESIMDIIAMICKDFGIVPRDDYINIESLKELNIIDENLENKLKKLNGLRNAIVHKYNKIEFDLVIQLKDEIVGTILQFIKKIEGVLFDE